MYWLGRMNINDTRYEGDIFSSSLRQIHLLSKKKPKFSKLVGRIQREIGFGNTGMITIKIKRIVHKYPIPPNLYGYLDICDDDDKQFIYNNLENIPNYKTVELFIDYEIHGFQEPVLSFSFQGFEPLSGFVSMEANTSIGVQTITNRVVLTSGLIDLNVAPPHIEERRDNASTSPLSVIESSSSRPTHTMIEEQDHSNQYNNESEAISKWDGVSELRRGLVFAGKNEVQAAVKNYSIRNHVSFRVVESHADILVLKCNSQEDVQGKKCAWWLQAMYKKSIYMWQITVLCGPHSCINFRPSQDHDNLDGNLIASSIVGMLVKTPTLSLDSIVQHVKDKWGYTISRKKAFGAKRKALEILYGSWEDSYNVLPRYLNALTRFNPGTITILLTDETAGGRHKMFKRLFWSFKPCIEGFKLCRPVIQIHGSLLYEKYDHTLLVATVLDGNNHILPIGFAIVESENKSSWEWFMECIRVHVTHQNGLCVISDMRCDILQLMNCERLGWKEPKASHRFCLVNFVKRYYCNFHNTAIKNLLFRAGAQAQPRKFKKVMDNIKELDERSYRWAMNIPTSKWSLSNDNGARCGHMSTYVSECVNVLLKGVRQMPVQSIVEHTLAKMAYYFESRRNKFLDLIVKGEKVTPLCKRMLEKYESRASRHTVTVYNRTSGLCEVRTGWGPPGTGKGYNVQIVELSGQKCSCGKLESCRMPCSHVIAVCKHLHRNMWDFVDKAHTLEQNFQVYNSLFQPLPQKDHWPDATSETVIVNPACKRQKGRSKSS